MTLHQFSPDLQQGLRLWASEALSDDFAFDYITTSEAWAWVCFQLRESEDRPEWFPKGKWASIQSLESALLSEARDTLGPHARSANK